MKKEILQCPNCGTEINVSDMIYHQIKEQIENESRENLETLLKEERQKIRQQIDEENELKISEKDRMIETLNTQMKEMQRKIEQGSMQVQGETQELAIENYLRISFPLDDIVEIKKGARGADSLQTVNSRSRQNCGKIYYESKRTKNWEESWIGKFKSDMREKNANLGAIVTDVMPKDMERFGLRDGVWVCTYQEFKGLCYVLRETVILYSDALATQENKGDKMVMLYDYLTSSEFKMQIEAIVESFSQMNTDLATERRSMEMQWKKREKVIQKVLQSTIHMYASIKGIAGNAVGTIQALELPVPEIQ